MRCTWILLVLAMLAPGCCIDPVNGSRYFCFGETSVAEEVAIGQEYAAVFTAENGGVYPDPQLQAYLSDIVVEKMARRSHRPDLPWHFTLLNTSDINAFALPGGQVFCTRGLLARLESEAQFAHLMGHEIGHVSHKHSLRGQGRSALFALLLGAVQLTEDAVLDPDEPHIISTTAGALGQLAILKFSRDQELESDARGVDYALAAGYDPREGKKTFEMFLRVKQASGQGESLIDGLLSTHPLDSTRIERIDSYIHTEYPSLSSSLVIANPAWKGELAQVQAEQKVYEDHDKAMGLVASAAETGQAAKLDQAETLLRSCASRLPTHATFAIGLGVVALQRENWSDAERNLDRALSLDPQQFTAHLYRGVVRQKSGNAARAREDLLQAHELNSYHPLPCYLLGVLDQDAGNNSGAQEWLGMAIERSAEGSEIRAKARQRLDALAAPAA